MPQDIKLRANTDAESVALVEPGFNHSIFVKRPHSAVSDFAIEKKEALTPTPEILSSRPFYFDIEKDGTVLDKLSLEFTAPALTIPVDGTYIRYQDYGYAHLKAEIRYLYSNSTVHVVYVDEIWSNYKHLTDEKRNNTELLVKGNLSAAQRNTLALAPQVIRIRLPTPWDGEGNQLAIVSLANKIRITMQFNDVQAVVQTDGTKPTVALNYTNVKLVYKVGHIPGRERIALANMSLRPDGINTLISDVMLSVINVPANGLNNVNGYPIDLRDFVGAVRHIRGIIRTTDQVDSFNPNTAYYEIDTSLLEGLRYRISANEKSLFEETDTTTDQTEYVDDFYPCRADIEQFFVFWDYDATNLHFASGHINLSNFTGSRLYLKRLVNHPPLQITLLGYRWNWTNLKNGNYQKIWQ